MVFFHCPPSSHTPAIYSTRKQNYCWLGRKKVLTWLKKDLLGSLYNYIHHLSHDLLLTSMTRVQPPLPPNLSSWIHLILICQVSKTMLKHWTFKKICIVKESCLLLVAKSLPHLVTRKRSGQFCSDSTCPNWWSFGIIMQLLQFSCCSRRYRVLQSFVTWFSQAKKIPNITRLITSQVPAPRGRNL